MTFISLKQAENTKEVGLKQAENAKKVEAAKPKPKPAGKKK